MGLFSKLFKGQKAKDGVQAVTKDGTKNLIESANHLLATSTISDVSSLNKCALALTLAEEPELAARCYQRALELDDQNVDIVVSLALILRSLGDIDLAFATIRKADTITQIYSRALYASGFLLCQMDRGKEADRCFLKGLELDRGKLTCPEAYIAKGILEFSQKVKLNKAKKTLRKATKLAPAEPTGHYYLAVFSDTSLGLNDWKSYIDTLRWMPTHTEAREKVATIISKLRHMHKEVIDYVIQSNSPKLMATIGEIAYKEKEREMAKVFFRASLELSMNLPAAIDGLARIETHSN